jgi:small ligand-binding sensory domain FIST
VLEWIHSHFPATHVLGGLAGDYLYLARGGSDEYVVSNDGILGVAVSGPGIFFDTEVSRACMPVTDILDIKASVGPHIQLLAERRPSAEEEKAIDMVQRSMSTLGGPPVSRMYFCGLSDNLERGFDLCRIRGSHPNGSIVVDGDTEGKTFLQIFALDAATSESDIKKRLGRALGHHTSQARRAIGALLFTCGGRGSRLYGNAGVEAGLFQHLLPGCGMSGFYGMGEIGPCALTGGTLARREEGLEGPARSSSGGGDGSGDAEGARISAKIMGFTAVFGVFFASVFSSASISAEAWEAPGELLAKWAAEHANAMAHCSEQ